MPSQTTRLLLQQMRVAILFLFRGEAGLKGFSPTVISEVLILVSHRQELIETMVYARRLERYRRSSLGVKRSMLACPVTVWR